MFGKIPIFDPDDDAPSDPWSRWGMGICIPGVIAAVGASCVICVKATIVGRHGRSMPLSGWDATATGIAIMAIALYLHAHYFWSNSERVAEYADLLKVVGLFSGIVAIGFVIVRGFALL